MHAYTTYIASMPKISSAKTFDIFFTTHFEDIMDAMDILVQQASSGL